MTIAVDPGFVDYWGRVTPVYVYLMAKPEPTCDRDRGSFVEGQAAPGVPCDIEQRRRGVARRAVRA